jgi:hypothetical protein
MFGIFVALYAAKIPEPLDFSPFRRKTLPAGKGAGGRANSGNHGLLWYYHKRRERD